MMGKDGLAAGSEVEVSLRAVVERLDDYIEGKIEPSRRDDDVAAAAYNLRREFAAVLPEGGDDVTEVWSLEKAESFCRFCDCTVEGLRRQNA